jgi:hypothetical protein
MRIGPLEIRWHPKKKRPSPAHRRLWKDIPPEERITVEFLEGRNGASDPEWLQKRIERLNKEPLCKAAVAWDDLYAPCSNIPFKGERLCAAHKAWKFLS